MVPYYKRQTAWCCLEATAIVIAMKVARDRAVSLWKIRLFVFGKFVAIFYLILAFFVYIFFLFIYFIHKIILKFQCRISLFYYQLFLILFVLFVTLSRYTSLFFSLLSSNTCCFPERRDKYRVTLGVVICINCAQRLSYEENASMMLHIHGALSEKIYVRMIGDKSTNVDLFIAS